MSDPRPATLEDLATVARVAAEGFLDDPVMSWALRDASARPRQLVEVFGGLARDVLPGRGRIDLLGEASVVFWREPGFPHGAPPDPPADDAAAPPAPERTNPFSDEELERFAVLDQVMHEVHPDEPHWYLNVISTVPAHQGRGFGARAVAPVLELADATGTPCYLESTNPRNRPFYRRLGFEDRDELQLPDGPTLLAMWRPAGG